LAVAAAVGHIRLMHFMTAWKIDDFMVIFQEKLSNGKGLATESLIATSLESQQSRAAAIAISVMIYYSTSTKRVANRT